MKSTWPGRVDQVELVLVAVGGGVAHAHGLRLDGDALLALEVHARRAPAPTCRARRWCRSISSSRSASVDLPWSMWAMMQKLRMRAGSIFAGRVAIRGIARCYEAERVATRCGSGARGATSVIVNAPRPAMARETGGERAADPSRSRTSVAHAFEDVGDGVDRREELQPAGEDLLRGEGGREEESGKKTRKPSCAACALPVLQRDRQADAGVGEAEQRRPCSTSDDERRAARTPCRRRR